MSVRDIGLTGWLVTGLACLGLVVVGSGGGTVELMAALLGSVGLVLARARLAVPYAFVVGHVTLVAVLVAPIPVGPVVFAEGALVALLFEPLVRGPSRRRTVFAVGVFGSVIGLVGWGTLGAWGQLWAVALGLFGTGGLIAYLLYRYEYVQLEVVRGE
jgi:hypothetical protein